jgi:enoyl-CoA hydratase/carnithine racemase
MDADSALRANLVSRVVEPAHLLAESHALARRLALRSPESVRGVKRLAHAATRMPIARGLALEAALFTACGLSAGAKDGCDRYLALAAAGMTAGDALDRLRGGLPGAKDMSTLVSG